MMNAKTGLFCTRSPTLAGHGLLRRFPRGAGKQGQCRRDAPPSLGCTPQEASGSEARPGRNPPPGETQAPGRGHWPPTAQGLFHCLLVQGLVNSCPRARCRHCVQTLTQPRPQRPQPSLPVSVTADAKTSFPLPSRLICPQTLWHCLPGLVSRR